MAINSVYTAIADLELLGQKPTLERIQALSGNNIATTVASLKTNAALLNLGADKIRLKPGAADSWQ